MVRRHSAERAAPFSVAGCRSITLLSPSSRAGAKDRRKFEKLGEEPEEAEESQEPEVEEDGTRRPW